MEGEKKRSWGALAVMIGVPVLLLAGYVSVYYATVEPFGNHGARFPIYDVELRFTPDANGFFSPIHEIDRRLRPHVWNPPTP